MSFLVCPRPLRCGSTKESRLDCGSRDLAVFSHAFQTALGGAAVAWTERGICGFVLPDGDVATAAARMRRRFATGVAAEPPEQVRSCISQVRRYVRGEAADFADVTLDLSTVDPFSTSIYAAAQEIRYGQTITYGELAARAGHPGLARQTGQALGRNPVPLLVPCHRIVAAGNRIGGFSAPGGAATKRRMLDLEGVGLNPTSSMQGSFGF